MKDTPTKDEKHPESGPLANLYESWFLEYASYVILERAVPGISDGLKPVQRRILHAMKEMDDGRFNKVANIIGQTMQYHPHGDASINDAIISLGQRNLLIETQGNWGDVRTGDNAAAPRYIEARLSKFALEVLFNDHTTNWQLSYDGRKREPVTLPAKFPILLAQGVEGIAVGLSTKILPHNFCELIHASIAELKGEEFVLYPDFSTGGFVDISQYQDGSRGGKVRIRASIEEKDKKTLLIKEIPFGTTTGSLIESILKANESGKIKIKKVIDNTAQDVEIEIQLQAGISPDITTDALYAFTDCEISASPNACVIEDQKPAFLTVSHLLKASTHYTRTLLGRELEIKIIELRERILFASLLKIFIVEGMYKNPIYEKASSLEKCFEALNQLFDSFLKGFYRALTQEDYRKLIEKPLSSITRFDVSKTDDLLKKLDEEINQTTNNLNNLTKFTIAYYQNLLKKYGADRQRKTQIRKFDTVAAAVVAANNQKLYINRSEGFIGFGLKKDEFICDCSDLDEVIIFRRQGICKVVRIGEKVFVGKDILYANVFRKNDERMIYNMVYLDGQSGFSYVKRFQVMGTTRDREYELTKGSSGSKCLYLSANPNAQAETIQIILQPGVKATNKKIDFDFASLDIKGRGVQGNILTKYSVRKIELKTAGSSTLGGLSVWYDGVTGRLNNDKRGKFLGSFEPSDLILHLNMEGEYELSGFEAGKRYEPAQTLLLVRFDPNIAISLIYFEGAQKMYFAKRFKIETTTVAKPFKCIPEIKGSKVILATTDPAAQIEMAYKTSPNAVSETKIFDLDVLTELKGWKALGNRISAHTVIDIKLIDNTDAQDPEKQQLKLF